MKQLKRCGSCKQLLPIDEFGYLSSSPDGYNSTCKSCRSRISRASQKRIKEEGYLRPRRPRRESLAEYNQRVLSAVYKDASGSVSVRPMDFDTDGFRCQLSWDLATTTLAAPTSQRQLAWRT